VIDVVPPTESEAAAQARAERHDWLKEHNYRVVAIGHADLARDLTGVLDSLEAALSGPL
jgi:very-short-patch-repair endonuclease